jgi:hypothetical protein
VVAWWRGGVVAGPTTSARFHSPATACAVPPCNRIYPRCTTKSNTFSVHLRVQRLEPAGNDPARMDVATARIGGSWRGSVLVEHFVDPHDPELPDFATQNNRSLDDFYRFRILECREFRPQ